MNKINIDHLKLDIENDKKKSCICECCERVESGILYIVQTRGVTGIFHVCFECSKVLEKNQRTQFLLINKD